MIIWHDWERMSWAQRARYVQALNARERRLARAQRHLDHARQLLLDVCEQLPTTHPGVQQAHELLTNIPPEDTP